MQRVRYLGQQEIELALQTKTIKLLGLAIKAHSGMGMSDKCPACALRMTRTWQDDMADWNTGQLSIHEIERRLLAHGLSDSEIDGLLPDLATMKSLTYNPES